MVAPRLCGSRKHYQPGAGMGGREWTEMGELECLTCSQVEEGRWGRLGIPMLGPRWEAAAAEAAGEGSVGCRPG